MDLTILERLAELSAEELTEVAESLKARRNELTEAGEFTADDVVELENLADAKLTVDAEFTSRKADQATLSTRAEAALAKLADEEPEPEPEVIETAPAEELTVETPVVETVPVFERPVSPIPNPFKNKNVAVLTAARPEELAPKQSAPETFMSATAHAPVPEGHRFYNSRSIAEAIARKHISFGNVASGISEDLVPIATGAKTAIDFNVGSDPTENFELFRDLQRSHTDALVASGAYNTPLEPIYEFFRLGEPQTPVTDALPSMKAPRGGIRYIPGWCKPATAGAFGWYGQAESEDLTPPLVVKNKARMPVASVDEVFVTALTQIVEFGNLQYRTFPEQVEAFMEEVAVKYAELKETYFLDFIDTSSTDTNYTFPYGASRSLLWSWTTAAVAYRKRHGMAATAPLDLYLPDWALEMIKIDITLDKFRGPGLIDIPDSAVTSALRSRHLVPVWYNDSATGEGQKFNTAQGAGALNEWPVNVVSYLCAPGTFAKLDGGSLDLGLVRDSTLNGTNDLQLFVEEWMGAVMLGCEAVKQTLPVLTTGSGPEDTAVYSVTP